MTVEALPVSRVLDSDDADTLPWVASSAFWDRFGSKETVCVKS